MIIRILTAAILIPFVLLAIFVFPLPVFLVVLDLLIVLSLREFGLFMSSLPTNLPTVVYFPCLVYPWILAYCPQYVAPFVIAGLLLLLSWCITLAQEAEPVSQELFTIGGKKVPCLRSELTHDGGHLNQAGQDAAAVELVRILSRQLEH